MSQTSYWEEDAFLKDFDIAVIGSGIVGLTAALFLKRSNPVLNIAILERGTLPSGASTKNAGFACFGSITELLDDIQHTGEEAVFDLVATRWKGLQELRTLVGDENLQFHPSGGFEIFRNSEESVFQSCIEKMYSFNAILQEITGVKNVFSVADNRISGFGFQGVSHLILNQAEGQLHPGRMMKSLLSMAKESSIQFFNGITVRELKEEGNSVCLLCKNDITITVKKVLVATNGFARKLLPDLQVVPARNQVLITEGIRSLPFRGTFHYDKGYYYFRNVNDPFSSQQRILLGGGRNLAPEQEQTDQFGLTNSIQSSLTDLLNDVILPGQNVKVHSRWSGILGVGTEKKPILEMISPSIGVSVRLGGMGVAIGTLLGRKASEMILKNL